MATLDFTVPFFAVIGLGFYAARRQLLPQAGEQSINAFVFRFSLPALFIHSLSRQDVSSNFHWGYFRGYFLASVMTCLVAMLIAYRTRRANLAELSIFAQTAAIPNISFLGLPIISSYFGDVAIMPIAIAILAERILVLPALLAMLDAHSPDGFQALTWKNLTLFKKVVVNPLILAILVGGLLAVTQTTPPVQISRVLAFLGNAAGPAALFALGASLARSPTSNEDARVAWQAVSLKLFVHPFFTWLSLGFLSDLPANWLQVGVLLAAMPVAVNVYVTAQTYGINPARVSTITLLSTILGLPTVTLIAHLMLR
jgi:predicted permease